MKMLLRHAPITQTVVDYGSLARDCDAFLVTNHAPVTIEQSGERFELTGYSAGSVLPFPGKALSANLIGLLY